MTRIVVLGGGEAGWYITKHLEKNAGSSVQVTLVDARQHLVYQPFLAEVVSSSIEERHIQMPYAPHLRRAEFVNAKVTAISAANKTVTLENAGGDVFEIDYDQLVVTLGAVTKTFPTPGIAENAVGLKSTEEAVYIRNKIIANFGEAATLNVGSERRKRLLTFVVVGGGFSGIECFAEMCSLIAAMLKKHRNIGQDEIELHLIEAVDHIMPEVDPARSTWVIEQMEARGAHVHLNTFVESAVDGVVKTSGGDEFPTDLIVWTAGTLANPVLKNSDLPLDGRGRLRCRTDLRIEGDEGIVEGVWGAGDCTCVEDLSGGGLPDGSCAPTAQHAFRQAKRLAKNLLASIEQGSAAQLESYNHTNAGAVAGLGAGIGLFTTGDKKHVITGPLAWLAHRSYHGFAMPSWERKLRIYADWTANAVLGRDFSSTAEYETPRSFFEKFAAKAK